MLFINNTMHLTLWIDKDTQVTFGHVDFVVYKKHLWDIESNRFPAAGVNFLLCGLELRSN